MMLNKTAKICFALVLTTLISCAFGGTTMSKEDIMQMLQSRTEKKTPSDTQQPSNDRTSNSNNQEDKAVATNMFSEEANFEQWESHEHEDETKSEIFDGNLLES